MNRRELITLVAASMIPGSVLAQSTPIPADAVSYMQASTLGEGWFARNPRAGTPPVDAYRVRLVYGGPNGARVVIDVFDLGEGLTDASARWLSLRDIFFAMARTLRNVGDPIANVVPESSLAFPPNVSDALRISGAEFFSNEPIGIGLFAPNDMSQAAIIRVEGRVNRKDGVPAVNWVAEQYFDSI